MSQFKEYQSKPITRLAYEVSERDSINEEETESTSSVVIDGVKVFFKHYEQVKPGDFIVYLNDSDVYHCDRAVFMDRNIVEDK